MRGTEDFRNLAVAEASAFGIGPRPLTDALGASKGQKVAKGANFALCRDLVTGPGHDPKQIATRPNQAKSFNQVGRTLGSTRRLLETSTEEFSVGRAALHAVLARSSFHFSLQSFIFCCCCCCCAGGLAAASAIFMSDVV